MHYWTRSMSKTDELQWLSAHGASQTLGWAPVETLGNKTGKSGLCSWLWRCTNSCLRAEELAGLSGSLAALSFHEMSVPKRNPTSQSRSPRWDSQSTCLKWRARHSHYYLLLPLGTGMGMPKLQNAEELTAQIQVPPHGRPPQQRAVHFDSGNLVHQPQTNHSASLS